MNRYQTEKKNPTPKTVHYTKNAQICCLAMRLIVHEVIWQDHIKEKIKKTFIIRMKFMETAILKDILITNLNKWRNNEFT